MSKVSEVFDVFTGYKLPVNTKGWYEQNLITFKTNNANNSWFYQTPIFTACVEPFADSLLDRVDWLKQNHPLHVLKIRDYNDRYTGNIHHSFYLMLPRPKDLLHYRMRWQDLVDA